MSEKVSQLPVATAINPSDIIPIIQSGISKQAPISALVAPVASNSLALGGLLPTAYQFGTPLDTPKVWMNIASGSVGGNVSAVGTVVAEIPLNTVEAAARYYRVSVWTNVISGSQFTVCEGLDGNVSSGQFVYGVIRGGNMTDTLKIIANQIGMAATVYYSVDAWQSFSEE